MHLGRSGILKEFYNPAILNLAHSNVEQVWLTGLGSNDQREYINTNSLQSKQPE
jgi:hypothetical protein